MPKYSGFDPIQSHNIVTTSPSTSGINYDSDPVSVYLPFDSDVQDTSANNHTVTAYGNAAISSTQAKFGSNSLSLDGTGDYLQIADNAAFEFGDGDLTIEAWLYQNDDTGHVLTCKRATDGSWSSGAWLFGINTNVAGSNDDAGNVEFWAYDYNSGSPLLEFDNGSAFSSGWHHFAITRAGDNWSLFVDGSQVDTQSWSGSIGDASHPLFIGKDTYSGGRYETNGYIDDFRIIKGVARYNKSFVPPSAAVGATLNGGNETNTTTDFTALYLPFTADINDDSSHGHTMTAYGNATISSTQSKFGSNAAYFDGSGDYIAITSDESVLNIGTEDFTFEAYVWFQDLSGTQTIFMTKDGTQVVGHYYLRTNGSKLQLQLGSISNSTLLQLESTTDLTAQTWTHVAATRIGSSLKLYIDGVEAGSGTDQQGTRSLVSGDFRVGIGRHGSPLEGYINDLRILKGHAKYRADFVPHTSPIGASVSETVNDLTVLYLPFDDDSFEDQARNHTVTKSGTAQLSTSVKKYGTSSLLLDGNSDYLSIPNNRDFQFDDGDFTIEAWVYQTNAAGSDAADRHPIVARMDGGSNRSFHLGIVESSGAQKLQFSFTSDGSSSTQYEFGGDVTINNWHHVALVRLGSTVTCYLNGTALGTTGNIGGSSIFVGTSDLTIGFRGLSSQYFQGYIDDVRIIKGKAKYTANFTAPTSALGSEVTESTTTVTTETKSLSSTWTMTNDGSSPRSFVNMRLDNTWANNEHLQIQPGHRWYGTGGGGGGGGTSITFKLWGAGGAGGKWNGGSAGSGGSGGFAKGTLPNATPGTTYNVVVGNAGGAGGTSMAAPLGGRGGGGGPEPSGHRGGSGGGFSGVFEGPVSIGNAIIVAGGGGGGGSYDRSGEDESGGGGGGTTGQDGANPGPAIGKGGTQSAGGTPYGGGGAGAALQGGDGDSQFSMYGGGGGGGYYGGSGGGADGSPDAEEISGGGGGSGYVAPALTDTANLQGVTGTAGSTPGQITAINPTASSDPDYTGSYGKGGGFNSHGSGGYVVITSPSGSTAFTSPGTYTVP